MSIELHNLSAVELLAAYRGKDLSPVEVMQGAGFGASFGTNFSKQ
jgi:hypothetical protein